MKAQVISAVLDHLKVNTARLRERTKTLQWWRDYAKSSANKNGLSMPDQELDYGDTREALLGVLISELANQASSQSATVVQSGGKSTGGTEGSVPPSTRPAEPSQVGQQGGGSGQGSTGQSTSITIGANGSVPPTNPATPRRCEDRPARPFWRTAIPYILSGIGFVGGGGTLGYAVSQYFQSDDVREGELLPYIQENGWHLPPKAPTKEKDEDG